MSRKTAPWFKCFPEDWLEDTRLLTLAQRGAYFDVLCLMYGSDGRLTDNDSLIAHKLHVHIKTWRAIRKVLVGSGLLTSEGKHLTNKRAMKIVKERHEKREALSRNANARWIKAPSKQTNPNKSDTSSIQLHSKTDAIGVQLQTDREIERKTERENTPLSPTSGNDTAWMNEKGEIELSDQERQYWITRLGDTERVNLALVAIVPYIQENSRTPLLKQVRAQLARQAADKKDRDARYGRAKSKTQPVSAFSGCTVRDTDETFAAYQARMESEGKYKPMPMAARE